MCNDQIRCRGVCDVAKRVATREVLPALGGAGLLIFIAAVVNHWQSILQIVGLVVICVGAGYAGVRWGIPAAIRNYNARNIQRIERVQLERPATSERLYRPAPAQPAITPPQVHNHLHIDHETAERLFRS